MPEDGATAGPDHGHSRTVGSSQPIFTVVFDLGLTTEQRRVRCPFGMRCCCYVDLLSLDLARAAPCCAKRTMINVCAWLYWKGGYLAGTQARTRAPIVPCACVRGHGTPNTFVHPPTDTSFSGATAFACSCPSCPHAHSHTHAHARTHARTCTHTHMHTMPSSTRARAQELRRKHPWVTQWLPFVYNNYPPHADIRVALGEYAWKPLAMRAVAATRHGRLLWLDAGVRITDDGALSNAFAHVQQHQFYTTDTGGQ